MPYRQVYIILPIIRVIFVNYREKYRALTNRRYKCQIFATDEYQKICIVLFYMYNCFNYN